MRNPVIVWRIQPIVVSAARDKTGYGDYQCDEKDNPSRDDPIDHTPKPVASSAMKLAVSMTIRCAPTSTSPLSNEHCL